MYGKPPLSRAKGGGFCVNDTPAGNDTKISIIFDIASVALVWVVIHPATAPRAQNRQEVTSSNPQRVEAPISPANLGAWAVCASW